MLKFNKKNITSCSRSLNIRYYGGKSRYHQNYFFIKKRSILL